MGCAKSETPGDEVRSEKNRGEPSREERVSTDRMKGDAGSTDIDRKPRDEGPPPPEKLFKKASLIIESGNYQKGEAGNALLKPIVVRFVDEKNRGLAGKKISFKVIRGGGFFSNDDTELIAITDPNGRAGAIWFLGTLEGLNNQRVEVSVVGIDIPPVSFLATSYIPGKPEDTKFEGRVVDNSGAPLEGVSVYLFKNNKKSPIVRTDKSGYFILTNIKDFTGKAHLVVDGTTVKPANSYPRLEYEVYNITGVVNQLDAPAALPKLEPLNSTFIPKDKTIEFKPKKIDGLKMVVLAGSVTFPGKKKSGTINISQVDPYWIPMPLPNGFASSMVVTIQPPDVRFWPPAPITFPNVDKAKPGTILPIFSFDHTKGRYVKVADGKVTADGKYIRSLPGQGIVKGGWHAPGIPTTNNSNTNIDGGGFWGNALNLLKSGWDAFVGDPVSMASGAFVYTETDLEIPGRGINFKFTRQYSNKYFYYGPLGYGWDHSYNLRLVRTARDTVTFFDGKSTYPFKWDPKKKKYVSPPGLFAELIGARPPFKPGNLELKVVRKRIIKFPKGVTYTFIGSSYVEIKDRFGNRLTLLYDGPLLKTVIDTLGRKIQFYYNSESLLTEIADFSGRRIFFTYTAAKDLKSVIKTSSDGTIERKITYVYNGGNPDDTKNHRIIKIIDEKGRVYLENKYDDSGRVIEQKFGPGVYKFSYFTKKSTPSLPYHKMTRAVDPNGNVVEYHFDDKNREVMRVIKSHNKGINDPPQWVYRRKFNRDNLLVEVVDAEGTITRYEYDENNPNRLNQGNLLKKIVISGRGPNKGQKKIYTYKYTDKYQLLRSATTPLGNCSGCNPKDYTVTYYYDFDEATMGDLNGDGDTKGDKGALVKTVLPPFKQPDGTVQKREIITVYNQYGQIIKRVNLDGVVTVYQYYKSNGKKYDPTDLEGFLQYEIVDPNGLNIKKEYEYNILGKMTAVADERGVFFHTVYNSFGEPILSIAPAPFFYKTIYKYDVEGNLIEKLQELKNPFRNGGASSYLVTKYKYNLLGKKTEVSRQISEGVFSTEKYEYDKKMNLIAIVKPNGEKICYKYDARDRRIEKILACGTKQEASIKYVYDGTSNLIETIFPDGTKEKREYDGFNRLVKVVDQKGNVKRYEYNLQDQITAEELLDSSGKVVYRTVYKYNNAGKIYREENFLFDSNGNIVDRSVFITYYSPSGFPIKEIDPSGYTVTYYYDKAGRPFKTVDSLGNTVEKVLNKQGVPLKKIYTYVDTKNPKNRVQRTVSYKYDSVGRIVEKVIDNTFTEKYYYDSLNRMVRYVSPQGHLTEWEYDGLGNIVEESTKIVKGGKVVATYKRKMGWDKNGNQLSYTDVNGNKALFQYDIRNRRTKIVLPRADSSSKPVFIEREFNNLDQVIREKLSNGTEITYKYDERGFLIRKNIKRGPNVRGATFVEYKYDAYGRLLEVKNDYATVRYSYDSLNRVTSESIDGKKVLYQYDLEGKITKITYPSGLEVYYSYHLDGKLKSIAINSPKSTAVSYQYIGGALQSIDFSNGLKTTRKFDRHLRLVEHRLEGSNKKLLLGYRYKFNSFSSPIVEKLLHKNTGNVYRFDELNRLVSAAYGVGDPDGEYQTPGSQTAERRETFKLDPLGNRLSKTSVQGNSQSVVKYKFNKFHQYTKVGNTQLKYDANGNLLRDDTKLYRYDYENRLVEVVDAASGEVIVQYKYDPLGRLLSRTTSAGTTNYYYSNYDVIEETDKSGKLLKTYVYRFGKLAPQLFLQGGKTYFIHESMAGSTLAVTDSSGNIVEEVRYDAFGKPYFFDGSGSPLPRSKLGLRYLYHGMPYDYDLKLYHTLARHYNPDTGSFLQPDPLGYVDTGNLYLFAGHNPLLFADPYGLAKSFVSGVSNFVVGAASFIGQTAAGIAVGAGDAAIENMTFGLIESPFGTLTGMKDNLAYKGSKLATEFLLFFTGSPSNLVKTAINLRKAYKSQTLRKELGAIFKDTLYGSYARFMKDVSKRGKDYGSKFASWGRNKFQGLIQKIRRTKKDNELVGGVVENSSEGLKKSGLLKKFTDLFRKQDSANNPISPGELLENTVESGFKWHNFFRKNTGTIVSNSDKASLIDRGKQALVNIVNGSRDFAATGFKKATNAIYQYELNETALAYRDVIGALFSLYDWGASYFSSP